MRRLPIARVVIIASLVLIGGPAAPAEEQPKEALGTRVNKAIDAGVAWLRTLQAEDGSFPLGKAPDGGMPGIGGVDPATQWAGGPWDPGLHAPCVYTLAACDVPRDDPVLTKGFERMRAFWQGASLIQSSGASSAAASAGALSCSTASWSAHSTLLSNTHSGVAPEAARSSS